MNFDEWYGANKERLTTLTTEQMLKEAYEAGMAKILNIFMNNREGISGV